MIHNTPCVGCTGRTPYCHAACAAYRDFRKAFDAAARERMNGDAIYQVQNSRTERILKIKRKEKHK